MERVVLFFPFYNWVSQLSKSLGQHLSAVEGGVDPDHLTLNFHQTCGTLILSR